MTKSASGDGTSDQAHTPTEQSLTGHVFVVRGLLESVASDAVIVPSSSRFIPRSTWWRALEISTEPRTVEGTGRARRFPSQSDSSRTAWILNVAHDGHPSVSWLVDGLDDALRKIEFDSPHTGNGRVRPLIAMPTLGVGQGGYEGVRGEVIKSLLAHTAEFVGRSNFDIVIVVENAADYAAFQSIRRELHPATMKGAVAEQLAAKIRGGDVALLLGAGVSVSAGLPTWDQLLMKIKQEVLPALDNAKFTAMNALDRAQLLSKSSGGIKTLGERTAEATGVEVAHIPTLAHCLLASLGVGKAITTNYDTLYEDAYKSANGPMSVSVLPRQEVEDNRSWLLKMHGDVADPRSIILSRRDFVQYDSERRPLASIVQSWMATSHLIVIGASMTDDNVLRLAHEVLAMNTANNQQRTLGTVVTLQDDSMRAALWEGDFDFITASSASDQEVAARDLEILLDNVAMHASDRSPYLLDARYGELLDTAENEVAARLRDIAERIRRFPSAHRRQRWNTLFDALEAMGEVEPHTGNPIVSSDLK